MSVLNTNRPSDVLVQEINLSQIIKGNSTSVSGNVVVSDQGRTDPAYYTDPDSVVSEYGNPDAKKGFGIYTGLDYFKEGDEAWFVRAIGKGALYAGVLMWEDSGVTKLTPITQGIVDPKNPDWKAITPGGNDQNAIALFYPVRGQGSYASDVNKQPLGIQIVSQNLNAPTWPSKGAITSSNTGGSLPAGSYEYLVSSVAKDGTETIVSTPQDIVIAGTSVTNSITLTWMPDAQAVAYKVYGRTADNQVGLMDTVGAGTSTFTDDGSAAYKPDTSKKPKTTNVGPFNLMFNVNVFQINVNKTIPAESFTCTLDDEKDGNGNNLELEQRINPFSSYIQVTSNYPNLVDQDVRIESVDTTMMGGGDSGATPTDFDIINAWNKFGNKQLYNTNLLINGGRATPAVQLNMDSLAVARGDAVALLDVPSDKQKAQQATNYRNLELNLNSTYSALFSPDVLESDNINGKQIYIPFSGWAAALCARTDRVANPAFSIAGLNRGIINVLKTRYTYDDGEMKQLFQAQINYTQTFIGQGTALWEQQTLAAQQSALSWLSVRRIVNVIKVSLRQFLLYSLQEPNDDFTSRQIVGACSDYLQAVQNARGITAFSVVSDSRNNSAADFNSALRRVSVIIVPTLPIHIIELQVGISKQGVSMDEVLAQLNT
ncbi:tail sheath [Burkholderia phage BCSR5]|nr:tail sheath [Burkholderia phage BCSR5]